VFIDGQAGTTGLRIREFLRARPELELLEVEAHRRKDEDARRELLNAADVSILCLPDDAARAAVALISNPAARVIDASTAHRVDAAFVYGMPELVSEQRAAIAKARRVSNPGCWPTCVCLLLRPLVDAGLLPPDAPLSIHGVSGYTGGGNAMIARWEDAQNGLTALPFDAPYAFGRRHKHAAEMARYARLSRDPHFVPAVGAFRCGMRVQIPLPAGTLGRGVGAAAVYDALRARYAEEPFVEVIWMPEGADGAELELDPRACNDTNRITLRVAAHPDGHVLLIAVLDNLAKGASGAAVQNLNLMLGLPETTGLLGTRV
jgi:N-acetyl-gamma-glutamyl-phosphate reductase